MKPNLYNYQNEAVEEITKFYNSQFNHGKIEISTGLGKSKIIIYAIQKILTRNKNCKILMICNSNTEVVQYTEELIDNFKYLNVAEFLPDIRENGVFLTCYVDILRAEGEINYNDFDLIILDGIPILYENCEYPFFEKSYKGKRLTITIPNKKNKLLENDRLIYKYDIHDAIRDGNISVVKDKNLLEEFLIPFLLYLGFEDINVKKEYKKYFVDMMANYNNEDYIFELKSYRTKYVDSILLENASYMFARTVKRLGKENIIPIMIVASKIDNEIKKEIFIEYQIEIWDISNLVYLCRKSQKLLQRLSLYVSYPIADIIPESPSSYIGKEILEEKNEEKYKEFEERLDNCKPGRDQKEDKEYEKICSDIIKYLFETEFFQMSTQHQTGDNLFRMDMICSLKGTTEFWDFLMRFFNTKFVVFEYKNYEEELSQNLIIITSKYLFPAALRNVAFIISRKGIDENSKSIINAKIKDEKKLIISLTDEDLLVMVALKDSGEDPSDYLLEKVENILMSLSI